MENNFEKVMSQKTDEELKEILNSNQGDYQPEAMEAALNEKKKRNLNIEPKKEKRENESNKYLKDKESVISDVKLESNRYHALKMISLYFKILAWLTLASTIWFIFYSMSHTEVELAEGVIFIISGLAAFVIFLAISELIKVVIDIEHNTRIAAINSSK